MKWALTILLSMSILIGACPCTLLKADICKSKDVKSKETCHHSKSSPPTDKSSKDPFRACCGQLLINIPKDVAYIKNRVVHKSFIFIQTFGFFNITMIVHGQKLTIHSPPDLYHEDTFYRFINPSHAPPMPSAFLLMSI